MKPLTVGELKKALEGLSDETQILLGSQPEGSKSDWFNVSKEFGIPASNSVEYSDYSAFTLFAEDTYDARQFN